MLYETRKTLLGFRLKLTFDESLNKDMSCIFVDVSKTATVGSLMNSIVERFKIPHNSFLTVQNCKVLPSESVYVLLDLNSVKINGPSSPEVRGTRSSDVLQEENASQKTSPLTSCNVGGDVVDGKSSFPKPRPPKRPIREGIAATIKKLLEEEEMERIGKECSGLSLSNDISKVQSTSHQETMNVDDDKAETNLHSEKLSDLTSDACSDLNIEKKKRKRKRKHAKNREREDQPSTSSSFTEPVLGLCQNTNITRGKHIRFDDSDDEVLDTSVDERKQQRQQYEQQQQPQPHEPQQQPQLYQQQQQLKKQERLLQQSLRYIQRSQQQQQLQHHQQSQKQNQQLALQESLLRVQQQQQLLLHQQMPTSLQETVNSQMPQSPAIRSTSSTPNGKSTENTEFSMLEKSEGLKQSRSGSSGGGIKQSQIISNLLNSQPEDKKTSDQSSIMETDDVTNAEFQSGFKNQTFQKRTKNHVQQSTSVSSATSAKPKNIYNQEESYKRPKSSLSVYNGRTSNDKNIWSNNSQTDSDNFGSSFINLPRLSESENKEYKPKHERVEKELATLLMCKQLDTAMEYTVQFSNEGDGFLSKSLLSLRDVPSSPISQSAVSQPNHSAKKSKTSNTFLQNVKTEGNRENGLPERMEASLDDCEFLKQVKLDGNQIRFRKSDGTWTVLTPEIANVELPKLEVPKENQSIVFRIVYLNQNFIPTSSELLYGQIVTYKANTNKLAVDIPQQFVKAIVKDCGDEVLPETIVPITGSIFEVDLSALIEPKVIS